jgi:NAD(P)-dependent dehydrogenase (short-subunit alcohol dehydrogenase family)
MNKLDNKVIIVTGGSGLLGKAIVNTVLAGGGVCINADIHPADQGEFIHCDITDPASIGDVIKEVVARWGRIDGLVNNAYPRTKDWGKRFEDIPVDSWRANVDMQLNSCFVFCQEVCAQMKKQGSGSVVNIGSIHGVVAPDFGVYEGTEMTSPGAYAAIKGGIIHFTRYLASYFGGNNIRVNCVSPGGIFDNQNPVFVRNYLSRVPLKRMGNPSDIAGPVSFLLSDDAAYVTGHNLLVDGGWTII